MMNPLFGSALSGHSRISLPTANSSTKRSQAVATKMSCQHGQDILESNYYFAKKLEILCG
jgi:hypothetical protein